MMGVGMTMPKTLPAGQGKESHGGQNRDPFPKTPQTHGIKINAGLDVKSIPK